MGYFRVTADSPSYSRPMEKVAATAVEAEQHVFALTRLSGRNGRVEVWGKDGRVIGPDKLATLARAEADAPADPSAAN